MKPSFGPVKTTTPKFFRLSTFGVETDISIEIAAAARDPNEAIAGILGAGLVLGKITASGKYAQYNNAASDGTEVAVGLLTKRVDLRDSAGTPQDGPGVLCTVGEIDANRIPASGANYTGLDSNAKADFAAATAAGEAINIIIRS